MDLLKCPQCGKIPRVSEIFGDYFVFCEGSPSDCFCSLHEAPFSASHYPFFSNEADTVENWNKDVLDYLKLERT